MPALGPIKRVDLVRFLKQFGFTGPYPGGKHQFMLQGSLKIWLPNPHQGDISKALLSQILRQAGISRDEWERL